MKNKNTTKYKPSLFDRLFNRFEDVCTDHPIKTCLIFTVTTLIAAAILFVVPITTINYYFGVDGFGPVNEHTITVNRLYVDNSSQSHYMVGTDKGVFEVQNFLLPIQLFNSDELYSKLEVGKTYIVKTKGNRVVNWLMQQYPYIIEIREGIQK